MRNVPPWIKCDTMASMNTKYGMATKHDLSTRMNHQ